MGLPPLPKLVIREIEDLSPPDPTGFLKLRRRMLEVSYEGARSEPFLYDNVDRKALDAVVVAAHFQKDAATWVYLRTAVRPALKLRPMDQRPLPEADTLGSLWELPAGLVEPNECSEVGLKRSAARELAEELGFVIAPEQFVALGPATFPSCGVIAERHHFFHVAVVPDERGAPSEDGSVLERGALIVSVTLADALALARQGEIEDAKTELGLRRLAELADG